MSTSSLVEPIDINDSGYKDYLLSHLTQNFLKAAETGDFDQVKEYLDNGNNVNARNVANWTALHRASRQGHYDIVKLLLEKGADPDIKIHHGHTSIFLATGLGHTKIVKLLIEYGATINHIRQIEALLKEDITDLNQEAKNKALKYASLNNFADISKQLFDNGAQM